MLHVDFRLIYLIGSLIILLLFLLVLYFRKDLRKISLLTGLMLIPSGPISEALFFKDYWYPPTFFEIHLFGARIILEDLIFAFSAPTFGALLYLIVFNKKFNKDFKFSANFIFKFYLMATPLLALFFGITLFIGVNSIFSITITAVLISTVILLKRKDLVRYYLITSALAFSAAFIFYYIYILLIGKEYLQNVWLLDHKMFGFYFLGSVIPVTEALFAATVIPCIFLFILTSANLKIASK